jgi:hypothetical protein
VASDEARPHLNEARPPLEGSMVIIER